MRIVPTISIVLFCGSLAGCDPNTHKASDHPCNFPDAETENFLRGPKAFVIIDKVTSENLVGTSKTSRIHADSVVLMDENRKVLPPRFGKDKIYEYYIDGWIFTNLTPYSDVPYNDPSALLNLKERTFYLQTAYNDIDTIKISFKQCLINPPVLFNNQNTDRPTNDPSNGGGTFYFKK
ncbi:MAG: hypothetical protein HOP30_02735 [Cyclobacteriaceae bacterium]|nr:hypothetical protein [Cyclobacteriaceae bacterium]